jgi:DNA invertase Pin-like site-specific DNA recombinase
MPASSYATVTVRPCRSATSVSAWRWFYADKEAMDATTPHGRAMLQMAAVFAELERSMIRDCVMAGLARVRAEGKKTLGRTKVGRKVEDAIRARLSASDGMLKVSKALGVGVSTVMRVREAMRPLPDAAL